MDPLQQFYLSLLLAQAGRYAGKPGSQLNTGDLNSIFSPDLGLLTGTLTEKKETDDDIYASVAPNIFRVRNNRDADPIATAIVDNLESGFSLPQTLIELRKQVSGEDLKAYKEYATQVSKEMGDVKSALGKRKTRASEAGFPEPDAQFDPTPLMDNINAFLKQQAQPSTAPVLKETKKKNEVGFLPLLKALNPLKLGITPRLTRSSRVSKPEQQQAALDKRYEDANAARAKIALQENEDVKNLLASAMQRNSLTGTPFGDELMKRTLIKRLIENPGVINKLTQPKG